MKYNHLFGCMKKRPETQTTRLLPFKWTDSHTEVLTVGLSLAICVFIIYTRFSGLVKVSPELKTGER